MTNTQQLQVYTQQLCNLRDDEDLDINALLVLSTRDALARVSLTDAEAEQLTLLDDKLVQHQSVLAKVLPFPAAHPRSEWWWFLHEGPQVRKQNKVLA